MKAVTINGAKVEELAYLADHICDAGLKTMVEAVKVADYDGAEFSALTYIFATHNIGFALDAYFDLCGHHGIEQLQSELARITEARLDAARLRMAVEEKTGATLQ